MNGSGLLFLAAIMLLSPHMPERFSKVCAVVCLLAGWALLIVEAANT